MTENELNQLHIINKEIDVCKRELVKLKNRSLIGGCGTTGMPFSKKISDRTAYLAAASTEIEEMLENKIKQLYIERKKIEEVINGIAEPDIRLIVRLRAIENLSWEDIAAELTIMDDRGRVIKEFSRQTVWRKYKKFLVDLDTLDKCK